MMGAIIPQSTAMQPHPTTAVRRAPLIAALALLVLAAPLGGCVYRMNIQQGNYLDDKAVGQLQVGMTRSQVRFLLGTPMVPDAFDGDRWDYLYYLKQGRLKAAEQRHLTVYFESDKVSRIEHDGAAAAKSADSPPEQSAAARSGT